MIQSDKSWFGLKTFDFEWKKRFQTVGFSSDIFDSNSDYVYFVLNADNHNKKENISHSENLIVINSTVAAIKHIIDIYNPQTVLAFKDEDSAFSFVYTMAATSIFGLMMEYDIADFYENFSSSSDNVKIIDCTENMDSISSGKTVFSIHTLAEHENMTDVSSRINIIAQRFSNSSFASFLMPQNQVSFQKYFYEINPCEAYEWNINRLLEYWKQQPHHANSVFIKDGVVCPQKWFSNQKRPLFLLKEAYGESDDWDLRKYLVSQNKIKKLWSRISEWTYGIMNSDTGIQPYKKCSGQTFSDDDNLKDIAIINVKKSNGRTFSDGNDIIDYAEKDRLELLKEIELCDPTIIICGYTSKALEIIYGENFRKDYNENLFYHIELNGHDVLVYDYWHPANHYPDLMNYYGLINIDFLAHKNN